MILANMTDHFHHLHLHRLGSERWWGWPLGGISASWVGGLWAQVDGTHVINLIALGVLGIGSSIIGLWRLYEAQAIRLWKDKQLAEIAVEEARRESAARVPLVAIVSPGAAPIVAPTPAMPPPAKDATP